MSFVAAAAIVGGAGLGAALLSRKSGGDGVSYGGVPESPEAIAARKKLWELAQGPPPDVPLRKIAPLPAMTEERKAARATGMELIQPQDFMELPEVQGIIYEAVTKGDLLANRLSRGLQSAGALTSTGGRDVLGRAVTDVQKNLASSLAPFAMEERGRRERMIPMLEALGLTEEERKRVFEQAGMSAEYEQELAESKQLETYTIPLLKAIIGLQPAVQPIIPSQQPSFLSQISPLLGPVLGAAIMKGGAGAGAGSYTPIGPGYPTNTQMFSNQWLAGTPYS